MLAAISNPMYAWKITKILIDSVCAGHAWGYLWFLTSHNSVETPGLVVTSYRLHFPAASHLVSQRRLWRSKPGLNHFVRDPGIC